MAVSDYRLRQRDYLLRLSRALNARLDLPQVLEMVVRYAVELTGGRAGAIALRGEDGRVEVAAHTGLDGSLLATLEPLLASLPVTPPDGPARDRWLGPPLRALAARLPTPYAQVIALPLVTEARLLGVLLLFRSTESALFTPLDEQLLELFADQAAVAIANADLYATLSHHVGRLGLLNEFLLHLVSARDVDAALAVAADYARRIVGADWVAIFCRAPAPGGHVERIQQWPAARLPREGALSSLQRRSAALLERDAPRRYGGDDEPLPPPLRDAGLAAALAIPIRGAEGALGVLWVGRVSPLDAPAESVHLLITLARPLGLALDKFTLLEQLGARERQLSTIVERNPAAVLLLDGAGRVAALNPVAALMCACPPELARREPLAALIALEDETGTPIPLELPGGERTRTLQGFLRRADGVLGPFVQLTLSGLGARADGELPTEGYVASMMDLSALHEAEQAKRIFLASLSHELKTPLSIIRGYAETLRHPQIRADNALYDESLDAILDETAHLTHMVDQMLLAARLEAGAIRLELDEVAPAALAGEMVESYRQTHADYQWSLEVAPDVAPLRADRARLRELLHNLLGNAVKYSEPGSPITVSVTDDDASITIAVRDRGIGIAAEDQPRLFERFFRASDRAEGTGLGLYLSRAIVEAHGGTIAVESDEGRGSTFTVTLPRAGGAA